MLLSYVWPPFWLPRFQVSIFFVLVALMKMLFSNRDCELERLVSTWLSAST